MHQGMVQLQVEEPLQQNCGFNQGKPVREPTDDGDESIGSGHSCHVQLYCRKCHGKSKSASKVFEGFCP